MATTPNIPKNVNCTKGLTKVCHNVCVCYKENTSSPTEWGIIIPAVLAGLLCIGVIIFAKFRYKCTRFLFARSISDEEYDYEEDDYDDEDTMNHYYHHDRRNHEFVEDSNGTNNQQQRRAKIHTSNKGVRWKDENEIVKKTGRKSRSSSYGVGTSTHSKSKSIKGTFVPDTNLSNNGNRVVENIEMTSQATNAFVKDASDDENNSIDKTSSNDSNASDSIANNTENQPTLFDVKVALHRVSSESANHDTQSNVT